MGLTHNLFRNASGISRLQKPDMIFLENANLSYILSVLSIQGSPNAGNIRETFFANQVGYKHRLSFPDKGDFLVDGKFLFEIGGKGKSTDQLEGKANAFIAADDIEYGHPAMGSVTSMPENLVMYFGTTNAPEPNRADASPTAHQWEQA